MKYVISNNAIPLSKHYQIVKKEALIHFLDQHEMITVDIETTGLDCHTCSMVCIQIGNTQDQFLIDTKSFDIGFLKPYLESKLLLGQNIKFDLKFLYKQGIYPNKVWDTFICEKVLYCGDKLHGYGLDKLVQRYLPEAPAMDKSFRSGIGKEGLTERVILYSLADVEYLEPIRELQLQAIKEKDLQGALNIENRFIPCLAYIEYCGFKLDRKKWQAKIDKELKEYQDSEAALNAYVMNKGMSQFISSQMDMFEPVGCTINWSAPQQVVKIFESIGVDCTVTIKGNTKKSVEAGVIKKYEKEYALVKLYLDYKKKEKVVTTYGESFLRQINPVTGRLHTNFTQILDTGRLSSGGKDKVTKEENINFQNIPSPPETRSCFVCEDGSTLIISDYSGQEQIVLANFCMDKNLLEFYDNGLADMHSFVASKMYPELEGLTLDEIKDNHPKKRQAAKATGFSINYGGAGSTIADALNIPLEEGDAIYASYFVAFPGLKGYFDEVKKQGLKDGYILFNPITRRKSYVPFYEQYLELKKELTQDYYAEYRRLKEVGTGARYLEMKEKISTFFRFKGDIERKSLNYPIQGTSAEITKISGIKIFDYILENNLFGIVKFVNTIHDENVLECPISMQDEIAAMVGKCMVEAGEIFCKRVPLKADPELSLFWKK